MHDIMISSAKNNPVSIVVQPGWVNRSLYLIFIWDCIRFVLLLIQILNSIISLRGINYAGFSTVVQFCATIKCFRLWFIHCIVILWFNFCYFTFFRVYVCALMIQWFKNHIWNKSLTGEPHQCPNKKQTILILNYWVFFSLVINNFVVVAKVK